MRSTSSKDYSTSSYYIEPKSTNVDCTDHESSYSTPSKPSDELGLDAVFLPASGKGSIPPDERQTNDYANTVLVDNQDLDGGKGKAYAPQGFHPSHLLGTSLEDKLLMA